MHTKGLTQLLADTYSAYVSTFGVYNPEKIPFTQLKRFRKRPEVYLGLTTIKHAILSAEYEVECESDDIKAFVTEKWLDAPIRRKYYGQELLKFDYGFSAQEVLWVADKDKKWTLKDFRNPDPEQVFWTGKGTPIEYDGFIQRAGSEVRVAADDSVWSTLDGEHGNLYGTSAIKPVHYLCYSLDINEVLADRTMEYYGAPFVLVTYPKAISSDGTTDANQVIAQTLGQNLRDFSVVTIPFEDNDKGTGNKWNVLVQQPTAQPANWENYLTFKAKRVYWGLCIPDRVLTEGSFGARSEAEQKSQMFNIYIDGRIQECVAEENEHIIKKLVEYNFGEDAPVCKIKAKPYYDERRSVLVDIMRQVLAVNPDLETRESFKRLAESYGWERIETEELDKIAAKNAERNPIAPEIGEGVPSKPKSSAPPGEGDTEETEKKQKAEMESMPTLKGAIMPIVNKALEEIKPIAEGIRKWGLSDLNRTLDAKTFRGVKAYTDTVMAWVRRAYDEGQKNQIAAFEAKGVKRSATGRQLDLAVTASRVDAAVQNQITSVNYKVTDELGRAKALRANIETARPRVTVIWDDWFDNQVKLLVTNEIMRGYRLGGMSVIQ